MCKQLSSFRVCRPTNANYSKKEKYNATVCFPYFISNSLITAWRVELSSSPSFLEREEETAERDEFLEIEHQNPSPVPSDPNTTISTIQTLKSPLERERHTRELTEA
ncbi:hypothetical protein L484_011583 [Morus notabilis]|uniref:Uncharacterized protein n=1 Tax=Morus notabilis TaxID=981085 RepID=W9RZ80_9ROSA|nr:hypothetical protein L484_011583 [Morus notabilis]